MTLGLRFNQTVRRWLALTLLLGGLLALGGCATHPNANPKDPLEPFNRGVSEFNDAVDAALLKPVATAYTTVTPDLIRTHISNFFGNLSDAWSFVNATLQLRPKEAANNFLRFNVNTFLGFGGLLDLASEMGIERTRLDFGQTLGRWGVPAGPYLVLPLLGPSSVRDAAGLGVESRGDLVMGIDHIPTRNELYVLRAVEKRANLLRATNMLESVALDKYSFTRDAYLQRRQNQIEIIVEEAPHLPEFTDADSADLPAGEVESTR
ncbi:VacJ family lipoprotein [Hydrogenophaga sp. 5NK40-0174]|uniref:MlaA family lipoprotein n=1 Tax=Hydrogenophaga sp. 5NK40-0174 TaxID=3127649 RepID=UPI00310B89E8